jgi:hypothetical protein
MKPLSENRIFNNYIFRGYVNQLSNDPTAAAKNYELCLNRRPSHSTCRLNYAELLERSGHSPEAELKECLRLIEPKSVRSQIDGMSCGFNLSRFYLKIGK